MRTHDSLGRRFATSSEPADDGIALTPTHINLFERIDWYGPLPTDHLFHLSGLNNLTGIRQRLRKLSSETNTKHGRYLRKPPEQFPILPNGYVPGNHHLVYSLDTGAIKALGIRYKGYPRSSSFEHQLMQSCVLAEFDIGTSKTREHTFIPTHRLTPRPLSFPTTIIMDGKEVRKDLQPDYLFAIDYGDARRLFFLEVDRGHEVIDTKNIHRKSHRRTFLQYREFVGGRSYREMLPKDPAVVLFVFSNETQMHNAMQLIHKITEGKGNNYMCFRADPRFTGKMFAAPKVSLVNYEDGWKRIGYPDYHINKNPA